MQVQNIEKIVVSAKDSQYPILINKEGVFQCYVRKKNCPQNQQIRKQVFFSDKNVEIFIVKIDQKNQRALLKMNQSNNQKNIVVDGLRNIEIIFKIMGKYSLIYNLQQCTNSFNNIGAGSFAQVFQVFTKWKTQLALKCFQKSSFKSDPKNKKAFYNQIQVMQQLSSPYIISFDYIFQTQKAFYLKMDYLCQNFKQKISKKLLIRQQKQFIKQLLYGLKEMKDKKIVHRDLKPENIMVKQTSQEEHCVIIDFGLATNINKQKHIFYRCGTPGFLAPQIANLNSKSGKITCSADMFSLGCIFFKMITKHYLFGGKTARQVLDNNRKCKYSQDYFNRLSKKQQKLLLKMIDINPKTRITPEQALKDSYFQTDVDDADEIPEEQCILHRYIQRISDSSNIRNMEDVNSLYSSRASLNKSITSHTYQMNKKESLRDSCLTFEMGTQFISEDDELRQSTRKSSKLSQKSSKKQLIKKSGMRNSSRTPEKSRFSKLPVKDLSNIL